MPLFSIQYMPAPEFGEDAPSFAPAEEADEKPHESPEQGSLGSAADDPVHRADAPPARRGGGNTGLRGSSSSTTTTGGATASGLAARGLAAGRLGAAGALRRR